MLTHKKTILALLIFTFVLLTITPFAHAQVYNGQIEHAKRQQSILTQDIPGLAGTDLPQYIKGIYQVGVGIVALLAVLVIMWGGLAWMTAGGNAGMIDNAKQWISGAVLGLVLALTSYLILNTINPQLLSLTPPNIEKITDTQLGETPICCSYTNAQGETKYVSFDATGKIGGNITGDTLCKQYSSKFKFVSDLNQCKNQGGYGTPCRNNEGCIVNECPKRARFSNQYIYYICDISKKKCIPQVAILNGSRQEILAAQCGNISN